MSNKGAVAKWMLSEIERSGCLYQDDVVDYLVRTEQADLLRENTDGNLVLGKTLLEEFRKLTSLAVVWVKSDFYWRYRVAEDEQGRQARG